MGALEKTLASAVKTEAMVTCSICGKKHLVTSDTFVVLYGDVRVGLDGDLITGNIGANGRVTGSTVLCRDHQEVAGFVDLVEGMNFKSSEEPTVDIDDTSATKKGKKS